MVSAGHQTVSGLSPDGSSLDFLTGDDEAAHYHLWISPDEVWFAMDGQERAIWRVFVW